MNFLKKAIVVTLAIISAQATWAQTSNEQIAKEVTAIVQRAIGAGPCNNASSFTTTGKSVSLSICLMECMGEQQTAKIEDLDIPSTSLEKHPFDSKSGLVVLSCRAGKKCVSRVTDSNLGSKRGVGCAKHGATVTTDSILISVNKNDSDGVLKLIKTIK